MWKWIILALAGYALYRLFKNDWKFKQSRDQANEKADMEQKIASGEMIKDPNCGTYISSDSSITVRDGETVYRFCSYDCRDAFLKSLQSGGRNLPEGAMKKED